MVQSKFIGNVALQGENEANRKRLKFAMHRKGNVDHFTRYTFVE